MAFFLNHEPRPGTTLEPFVCHDQLPGLLRRLKENLDYLEQTYLTSHTIGERTVFSPCCQSTSCSLPPPNGAYYHHGSSEFVVPLSSSLRSFVEFHYASLHYPYWTTRGVSVRSRQLSIQQNDWKSITDGSRKYENSSGKELNPDSG